MVMQHPQNTQKTKAQFVNNCISGQKQNTRNCYIVFLEARITGKEKKDFEQPHVTFIVLKWNYILIRFVDRIEQTNYLKYPAPGNDLSTC